MISCILWTVAEVYLLGVVGFGVYTYFWGPLLLRGELFSAAVCGLQWPLVAWEWFRELRR